MRNIMYGIVILISIGIGSAESQDQFVGRISIHNGTIIEFQSTVYYDDGSLVPLGALTQNAINAGYSNIQERYITQYEYSVWRQYGIYPPSQGLIESIKLARLQQQASNTQNQTIAERIKQNYTQAMTDLNTIQNANPPFTSAGFNQVVWAQKREAAILQDILRFLKWIFFKSE